jgi:hypothetical protein
MIHARAAAARPGVARHQPDDRRRHQRPQHRREIGKQNTHEQRCREHRGGVAAKRLEGA